jgi:hypothetical protein
MRRCQHRACRGISRSTSAIPSPQFYFDSAASVSRSRSSTCVTLSPANAKVAGQSGPISRTGQRREATGGARLVGSTEGCKLIRATCFGPKHRSTLERSALRKEMDPFFAKWVPSCSDSRCIVGNSLRNRKTRGNADEPLALAFACGATVEAAKRSSDAGSVGEFGTLC